MWGLQGNTISSVLSSTACRRISALPGAPPPPPTHLLTLVFTLFLLLFFASPLGFLTFLHFLKYIHTERFFPQLSGSCFLFFRLTTTIIFLVFVISWGCFGSFLTSFYSLLILQAPQYCSILSIRNYFSQSVLTLSSFLWPLQLKSKIFTFWINLSPRSSVHFIPSEIMSSFQVHFLLRLCKGGFSLKYLTC